LTHPCIADAAVIPYPDDEAGEVPKGIIVLKEPVEPQAILDYVAERVAPHKRIRHLEFTDKIPKSPSGKILRRVLVDAEKAKSASS
jgi:acyl-coenzyme A synthetase/AMP-(fatty) acid ligase